jgi:hypothetical protein
MPRSGQPDEGREAKASGPLRRHRHWLDLVTGGWRRGDVVAVQAARDGEPETEEQRAERRDGDDAVALGPARRHHGASRCRGGAARSARCVPGGDDRALSCLTTTGRPVLP